MDSYLSRNQGGVSLLRAYVAIQTAAQLKEPLMDADVDNAFNAVQTSEARSESPVFQEILDVHRELAEHYWSLAHLNILRGTLAHQNDEYSYEGTIYRLQRENNGPVSREKRAQCEPICKEMTDLSRQIETEELKAWKEQDEDEYLRYKDELEARDLQNEINANDADETELASAEVVSILETQLESLLFQACKAA